jgi:hypothetical protein
MNKEGEILMKKSKLVLALAAAAMVPGAAFSAPPTAFGNGWALNADGVTIDHTCPTGFTCDAAPIADNNFLQVQMTDDATGATFFRTIVATADATDTYNNESFVVSGATAGGIAASQTLNSNTAGSGVLQASTTLSTGDFNTGDDQVVLNQGVWDAQAAPTFHSGFGYTKDTTGTVGATTLDQQIVVAGEFSDSFGYNQQKDLTTDTVMTTVLDIVSGAVINTGGTVSDQTFRYHLREGAAVTGAGSADIGASNITWNAGDSVARVLVGQSVLNAGDFGYDRVANNTTPAEITTFSLASVGPFATINPIDPFAGSPSDPTATTITPAP